MKRNWRNVLCSGVSWSATPADFDCCCGAWPRLFRLLCLSSAERVTAACDSCKFQHVAGSLWIINCLVFIQSLILSGWEQLSHPYNPPHYDCGLWVSVWVNWCFFTICMYKHCCLPLLLVFVMKCCVKMRCSLPQPSCFVIIAAWFLHLHACFACSSVHHMHQSKNSSPIAWPPSSVLCWCLGYCVLFFFYPYHPTVCRHNPSTVGQFNYVVAMSLWLMRFVLVCVDFAP